MGLAIFDIDGTVVFGRSTERAFAAWLWRRGVLRYRGLAAFAGFLLRYLPRYGRHITKKNKAWLTGLAVATVEEEANRFIVDEVTRWLAPDVVARLDSHIAAGDQVVLLSGTLDCLAAALGRQLGIADCVGTSCLTDGDVFVAAPPTRHPFAESKRELLDDLCSQFSVSPREVTAYADSHHDILLLDAVGFPVAVNPDKRLSRMAKAKGWEVLRAGLAGQVGNASG
jgi:HAD superfamily hydrolase (TIGR01490 family)